jgi:hypothetical protein
MPDPAEGTVVPMQKLINLIVAASLVVMASASAYAQGAPQTVTLMKVDPQSLATGYRTSKVVGSTVVNDANETVGSIGSDRNTRRSGTVCRAVGWWFPRFGHEIRCGALYLPEDRGQENGSSGWLEGRSSGPSGIQI